MGLVYGRRGAKEIGGEPEAGLLLLHFGILLIERRGVQPVFEQ